MAREFLTQLIFFTGVLALTLVAMSRVGEEFTLQVKPASVVEAPLSAGLP